MGSHPALCVAVRTHMSERGEDVETGQDLAAHNDGPKSLAYSYC